MFRLKHLICSFVVGLAMFAAAQDVVQARLNLDVVNANLANVTIRINHETKSTTGKSYTCMLTPQKMNIIHIRADGYEDHWVSMSLKAGEFRRESIRLTPRKVPYYFTSTQPEKVDIYKDGKLLGTTPFTAMFDYGERPNLVYRANGFHDQKKVFERVTLEPIMHKITMMADSGGLFITTRPEGATVYLDEIKQEGLTPWRREGLKQGVYQVRVEKPGFLTQSLAIQVIEGKVAARTMELEKEGGVINVTTDPQGATIFVNNVAQAEKSNCRVAGLKEGIVKVRAELKGHEPQEMAVTLIAGQVVQVPMILTPQYGEIAFVTSPANVEVRVDGRLQLTTEPLTKNNASRSKLGVIKLPIGAHTVQFSAEGYEERSVSCEVFHRERTSLETITLAFKPNIRVYTNAGVYEGWHLSETGTTLRLRLKDGRIIPLSKSLINRREAL